MNRVFILLIPIVGSWFLGGCATNYGLQPGSYARNYIKIVNTDADWLIHPTGQYKAFEKVKEVTYQPKYREVDDMERAVLEMQEKGYVMIGYSAVNTRERGEKQCDRKAMDPHSYTGCVIALKMRGIDPDMDNLGSPIHAAIWANAETVVAQRNYSFSRQEMRQVRIVASEGTDTSRSYGYTDSGYNDAWASSTYGQSNTQGRGNTSGSWNQKAKEAHADVGASGLLGPTGNVGGSVSDASGTSRGNSAYNEQSQFGSVSAGGSAGTAYQDSGNLTVNQSKHWATALVAKQVDHYDYMVTFWKKADLSQVVFGVITESTARELWPLLGTRGGRSVSQVIGNSPAYYAEIWEGDIIVAVNGEQVLGEESLSQLIDANQGNETVVTIWRDGNYYDVTIRLNRRTG